MSLLTGAPPTATVVAQCASVRHDMPQSVLAALRAEQLERAALLLGVVAAHLQRDSGDLQAASVQTPQTRRRHARRDCSTHPALSVAPTLPR